MATIGFALHHLGYLTDDLDAALAHWSTFAGVTAEGEIVHDAGQQARVRLLREPGARHWIELITPDSPESHLHKALQRNVTLHHTAYAVDDFDAAVRALRATGCVPLGLPVTGAAFGRPIMWFQDPYRGLVELIAPGPGPYQREDLS